MHLKPVISVIGTLLFSTTSLRAAPNTETASAAQARPAEAPAAEAAPTHEPAAQRAPEPTAQPEPKAVPAVGSKADKDGISFPGWPLKVGASMFTRFEMREGYDRLGRSRARFTEGELAVYRARLRLDTAPIEIGAGQSVQIRFAPQVAGFWGNLPNTVAKPDLGINEAYLRLANDLFTLDVGHFMMNYGDALVIGDLRWHQNARSFDGGRIRVSPGDAKYWVDVFFTQLSEGWSGPDPDAFAGDAFFTGIYADLGPLLGDKTVLEPYLLGQLWLNQDDVAQADGSVADVAGAVQGTLGVRAKQTYGIIDLRLETGIQFGKRRAGVNAVKVFAYHVDAEVGVKPMKGLRLSLEGLYASGDDPDTETVEGWDHLYPTAHKFLGLMDVTGARANMASGVLHVAYTGLKPIILKLDGHVFIRPQTADGVKAYEGTELDLNVIYLLGKGLKLRVMYAVFIPGSDHFFVNDEAVTDPAHYVEAQFGFNF